MITQEIANDLIHYDPISGNMTWKQRKEEYFSSSAKRAASHSMKNWNSKFANSPALNSLDTHGYKHGSIFGKMHLAHRVIWLMVYGQWPDHIDHIDGNRANNAILNLRDVSKQENSKNQRIPVNSKTGFHGVIFDSDTNKYRVRINIDGKRVNLGRFKSLDDAVAVRKSAEESCGYHPNHGRIAA